MNVPIIEDALVAILSNPPVFDMDPNREMAAKLLRAMDYGVFVASRPQGSQPMAITIDDPTGRPQFLLDHREPIRELI